MAIYTSAWLASITTLALLNIPYFYVDLQWTTQAQSLCLTYLCAAYLAHTTEEPANPSHANYCCFKPIRKRNNCRYTWKKAVEHCGYFGRINIQKPEQVVNLKQKQRYPMPIIAGVYGGWCNVNTGNCLFTWSYLRYMVMAGVRLIFTFGALERGRIAPQSRPKAMSQKLFYQPPGAFTVGSVSTNNWEHGNLLIARWFPNAPNVNGIVYPGQSVAGGRLAS